MFCIIIIIVIIVIIVIILIIIVIVIIVMHWIDGSISEYFGKDEVKKIYSDRNRQYV